MHIVTLENFLCCFRLETGGYFLGWLGTIGTVLGLIFLIALAILAAVSYDVIEDFLEQSFQNETSEDWAVDLVMNSSRVYLLIIFIFVFCYCAVSLYVSISLIIGTKNRTAERLVPYLILTVVGVIINFFTLITPSTENIVDVIINTLIGLYLYICVYSLYIKFKNEKKYKFEEEHA